MKDRQPVWSDLLFHADQELMSFALLYNAGLVIPSLFHAGQAIEKYLKALALSVNDPDSTSESPDSHLWLRTYDVGYLVQRCGSLYPTYKEPEVLEYLYRFNHFEQISRFPWMEGSRKNPLTKKDIAAYFDIIKSLRNDVPIEEDDYPLALLIRGYRQKTPDEKISMSIADLQRIAVASLKKIFPMINELVRW